MSTVVHCDQDLIRLLCSTMDYIREEAPIVIHFHLDKCVDFFIKDTVAVMCLCPVIMPCLCFVAVMCLCPVIIPCLCGCAVSVLCN